MSSLFSRGGTGPALTAASLRRQPAYDDIIDHAARLSLIGLFVLGFLFATAEGRYFLVPVTTALIVGFTFGPVVDWLERHHVPSYGASTLLIILIAALVFGLYLAFALPLQEWGQRLPEIWAELTSHLQNLREPLERLNQASQEVERAAGMDQGPQVTVEESSGFLTTFITLAPPIAAQFLLFGATLFFFMANRSRLRIALLSFCLKRDVRLKTARIIRDTEYLLSRYVAAISVVNLCLGVVVALAMYLLAVPSPALWGALATVMNFIPYLGPAVVFVILIGVGSATFDGLLASLTPAIVFLGINIIEGQIITPTVVGRNLTLNPFMVFLALGFWLWIWGPVGAFVAVPLVLVATVVANHMLPRRPGSPIVLFGKPAAAARKAQKAA